MIIKQAKCLDIQSLFLITLTLYSSTPYSQSVHSAVRHSTHTATTVQQKSQGLLTNLVTQPHRSKLVSFAPVMCFVTVVFMYCPYGSAGDRACPHYQRVTGSCTPYQTSTHAQHDGCCDPVICTDCSECPVVQHEATMVDTLPCPDCAARMAY